MRLAELLCAGDGLPKDNVEAYKWLEVAASKESRAAAKERDALAQKMSPEQVARARELAKRFQPKPSPASSLWIEEPLDSR